MLTLVHLEKHFVTKPLTQLHCLVKTELTNSFSQVAQAVKNPLAMQETQETGVLSLGQEDPLEYEMATHPRNLAWRTPWTE